MEMYYPNLSTIPQLSEYYGELGSRFGALAVGIPRVALPLAKFIVPAAKRIGNYLLVQGAPELIDISIGNRKPKQSLKNTVETKSKAS